MLEWPENIFTFRKWFIFVKNCVKSFCVAPLLDPSKRGCQKHYCIIHWKTLFQIPCYYLSLLFTFMFSILNVCNWIDHKVLKIGHIGRLEFLCQSREILLKLFDIWFFSSLMWSYLILWLHPSQMHMKAGRSNISPWQTDRLTDRLTDRTTDRPTDIQRDRHFDL